MSDNSTRATIKLTGSKGGDILLTVVEGSTVEDVQGVIDTLDAGVKYAAEKYNLTPQTDSGPGPRLIGAGSEPQQGDFFNAETLTATVDNGKAYWKVKGGRFQKWGVAIYPEVLEAAGIEADPLQPQSLAGWVAHYQTNDKGNPKKVTRLERIN